MAPWDAPGAEVILGSLETAHEAGINGVAMQAWTSGAGMAESFLVML
jgi:hypothetical protein